MSGAGATVFDQTVATPHSRRGPFASGIRSTCPCRDIHGGPRWNVARWINPPPPGSALAGPPDLTPDPGLRTPSLAELGARAGLRLARFLKVTLEAS